MSIAPDLIDGSEAAAIRGLRFRPYAGPSDHAAIVEIGNAARTADGMTGLVTLEGIANYYEHLTNCDPRRDVVVAELDGTPVAYGRTWWADRTSGERAFEATCHVRPEVRGRGIGTALLAIQDRHRIGLARSITAVLVGRAAILTAYTDGPEAGAVVLFEAAGYRVARRHAEMMRPDLESIPDLSLPDGLELRRVDPRDERAIRRAFDVDAEVFRDHWGDVDDSETAWESFRGDPNVQPALWVVAVEAATGEVAGQILNYTAAPGPGGRVVGWTESIAVRRPWRRRGLASAMLAASLRAVRDAGATSAALGVDLDNANRASAIYARLGFRVSVEELEYHRTLGDAELGRAAPGRSEPGR